jgi:hypothetical protein
MAARPTFFECLAAEELWPTIQPAFLHILNVAATRWHSFFRLLRFQDELSLLVRSALEFRALTLHEASFSEVNRCNNIQELLRTETFSTASFQASGFATPDSFPLRSS